MLVVSIGFLGGVIFLIVQLRLYLSIFLRWRQFNREIVIEGIPSPPPTATQLTQQQQQANNNYQKVSTQLTPQQSEPRQSHSDSELEQPIFIEPEQQSEIRSSEPVVTSGAANHRSETSSTPLPHHSYTLDEIDVHSLPLLINETTTSSSTTCKESQTKDDDEEEEYSDATSATSSSSLTNSGNSRSSSSPPPPSITTVVSNHSPHSVVINIISAIETETAAEPKSEAKQDSSVEVEVAEKQANDPLLKSNREVTTLSQNNRPVVLVHSWQSSSGTTTAASQTPPTTSSSSAQRQ